MQTLTCGRLRTITSSLIYQSAALDHDWPVWHVTLRGKPDRGTHVCALQNGVWPRCTSEQRLGSASYVGLTAGGRCDNLKWTGLINHCVVTLALVSVYVSTNWNPAGTRLRQTRILGPPTISSRWGEFRCLAPIGYLQLAVLSLPAEAKSHGHV